VTHGQFDAFAISEKEVPGTYELVLQDTAAYADGAPYSGDVVTIPFSVPGFDASAAVCGALQGSQTVSPAAVNELDHLLGELGGNTSTPQPASQRLARFEAIQGRLDGLMASFPDLAVVDGVGGAALEAQAATNVLQQAAGIADGLPLDTAPAVRRAALARVAVKLAQAQADLVQPPFGTTDQLREYVSEVDTLAGAGGAVAKLIDSEPVILSTVKQAVKATKLGADAAELVSQGRVAAACLVPDALSAASPVLPGLHPLQPLLKSELAYAQELWRNSTSGLDVVGNAIATGKLDHRKFQAVARQLRATAAKGPFSRDTAIEFAASLAEPIGLSQPAKAALTSFANWLFPPRR
jgi:hypothetical protein